MKWLLVRILFIQFNTVQMILFDFEHFKDFFIAILQISFLRGPSRYNVIITKQVGTFMTYVISGQFGKFVTLTLSSHVVIDQVSEIRFLRTEILFFIFLSNIFKDFPSISVQSSKLSSLKKHAKGSKFGENYLEKHQIHNKFLKMNILKFLRRAHDLWRSPFIQ